MGSNNTQQKNYLVQNMMYDKIKIYESLLIHIN